MKEVLFIDRDGVIARMVKYGNDWDSPQNPEDVTLVEGIEEVVSWANKNGILVIEISNQPGVAKGKMTQETSDAIEERAHALLSQKGATIDATYICPHHVNAVVEELKIDCDCKKPKPGLLIRASKELDINLKDSIFLGDKASDVEAGTAAGCKTILFIHQDDEPDKVAALSEAKPDYKIEEIHAALPILQDFFKLN